MWILLLSKKSGMLLTTALFVYGPISYINMIKVRAKGLDILGRHNEFLIV